MTTISRFFQRERINTDKSLVAERDKATETLNVANFKSQGQTDEIVKNERFIADQKTASSRAIHDGSREGVTENPLVNASHVQLLEERRRSDLATELERSKVDEAILQERKIASHLVDQVLELERSATDKNLYLERMTTDDGFDQSSKLLATELDEHKRTKSSLTSRDEFLAIVSHDLRNPIGAISSYGRLILDGVDGEAELGATTRQFVEVMKRNADASLRLISDLLDVEKISHGKLELHRREQGVKNLVNEAVERFMPVAREAGLTLTSDEGGGVDLADFDRDRILQVLGNLIGNSIKFTPSGGQITIKTEHYQDDFIVSVTDTGPGIPAGKTKQIFERFAQLTSLNRNGLGLGLYISKMIIEAHGGHLWVESTQGNGSTFKFCLHSKRAQK